MATNTRTRWYALTSLHSYAIRGFSCYDSSYKEYKECNEARMLARHDGRLAGLPFGGRGLAFVLLAATVMVHPAGVEVVGIWGRRMGVLCMYVGCVDRLVTRGATVDGCSHRSIGHLIVWAHPADPPS